MKICNACGQFHVKVLSPSCTHCGEMLPQQSYRSAEPPPSPQSLGDGNYVTPMRKSSYA